MIYFASESIKIGNNIFKTENNFGKVVRDVINSEEISIYIMLSLIANIASQTRETNHIYCEQYSCQNSLNCIHFVITDDIRLSQRCKCLIYQPNLNTTS